MPRTMPDRRAFIASTALAAIGVRAQAPYPAGPIRIVIPFAAGGATDVLGRDLGKGMQPHVGSQPLVIENMGGGAGVPALNAVVRAKADGYTLLFAASGNITAQPLLMRQRVDILTQLAPVGMVATAPHVLVVSSKLPFRSVAELVAYARAHPGELDFGTAGVGGLAHLGTELFARAAQIDIKHIPYRGASSGLTDLVSGQIHAMFGTLPSFTGMVETGGVRVIGLTAPSASAALKGIPLISATVPGFGYKSWNGLFAPAATPAPVIAQLHAAMAKAAADKAMAARFDTLGVDVALANPQQLAEIVRKETAVWDKVIRDAKITPT
ncbi:Bug family tripartite tricarboxylate transporter substrate binding protein [Aquabacterium sp.]|uniref:Bug family tripartite tricarboxylate transporter substrate binding protein n=1 Tax=Aquabacterium sp. TaxID=1872578 RepID=UPI0037841E76